jgi:hypothetical protein
MMMKLGDSLDGVRTVASAAGKVLLALAFLVASGAALEIALRTA